MSTPPLLPFLVQQNLAGSSQKWRFHMVCCGSLEFSWTMFLPPHGDDSIEASIHRLQTVFFCVTESLVSSFSLASWQFKRGARHSRVNRENDTAFLGRNGFFSSPCSRRSQHLSPSTIVPTISFLHIVSIRPTRLRSHAAAL